MLGTDRFARRRICFPVWVFFVSSLCTLSARPFSLPPISIGRQNKMEPGAFRMSANALVPGSRDLSFSWQKSSPPPPCYQLSLVASFDAGSCNSYVPGSLGLWTRFGFLSPNSSSVFILLPYFDVGVLALPYHQSRKQLRLLPLFSMMALSNSCLSINTFSYRDPFCAVTFCWCRDFSLPWVSIPLWGT